MFQREAPVTIKRKWFTFPVSIQDFSMTEDAKVATYEYALRDGAEHERVLAYRKFTISWIFTSDSGNNSSAWYAQKFRQLNDNKPGVFFHPVFGSYTCILAALRISENGEENESLGSNNNTWDIIGHIYKFDAEFWETTDPQQAKQNSKISRLYPAATVRPPSNFYKTTLKYTTCDQLYRAIVNGNIAPWTNPVTNAEWLQYPLSLRQCAYGKRLANPTGANSTSSVSSSNQRMYTVIAWDRWIKIAKKFNIPFTDLFNANKDRNVRVRPRTDQGLRRKNANKLRPGDTLIIPDVANG